MSTMITSNSQISQSTRQNNDHKNLTTETTTTHTELWTDAVPIPSDLSLSQKNPGPHQDERQFTNGTPLPMTHTLTQVNTLQLSTVIHIVTKNTPQPQSFHCYQYFYCILLIICFCMIQFVQIFSIIHHPHTSRIGKRVYFI